MINNSFISLKQRRPVAEVETGQPDGIIARHNDLEPEYRVTTPNLPQRGTYLIERMAVEEVLTALKKWI